MSSRLTLFSHAATAATRGALFPKDESIEDPGHEALGLAANLGPVGRVWVAPERRAVETAAALGLNAEVEKLLRDFDLGRWSGLSFQHVETSDGENLMAWLADPACAPHGGETLLQLLGRISGWLDGIKINGLRAAAVTHPAIIRAAIVCAINAAPPAFWRIDVSPLARAELRSNGTRWTLRSLVNS